MKSGVRCSYVIFVVLFFAGICTFGCSGNSGESTGSIASEQTKPALYAAIDSPAQDVSIAAGESITFKGSAMGGESPYTCIWNFGEDGWNATQLNPGDVIFSLPGTYTVTFIVLDSLLFSAQDSLTVRVCEDAGPAATIVSPSQDMAITAGESLCFRGMAEGGSEPYSYAWYFGADTVESAEREPAPVVFSSTGIYLVTFTATDVSGKSHSDSVTIIVEDSPDTQPTATIDSPAGDITRIYKGESVHFHAAVTGGDLPLSYFWDFGGGTENMTVPTPGVVPFSTSGTFTVSVTVTDSDGDTGFDTATVIVEDPPDLADALCAFFAEPTQEHFNSFMYAFSFIGEKTVEEILQAFCVFADEYTRLDLSSYMEDLAMDLHLESLVEYARNCILNLIVLCAFDDALYPIAADIEDSLAEAQALLSQIIELTLKVQLEDGTSISIDTIDLDFVRASLPLIKSFAVHAQTLDYHVADWCVTAEGTGVSGYVDMREIIQAPDQEPSSSQIQEFFENNPALLGYLDRTSLAAFRSAVENAIAYYNTAVDALDLMEPDSLRERCFNLFSIDSDFDLVMARALRDHTLPSVLHCFDDPQASLVIPRPVELSRGCIDGGDGFFYQKTFYAIYLDTYTPTGTDITIFDLFNPSGTKTLSDLFDDLSAVPSGDPYQPYTCAASQLYRESVRGISWDEPLEVCPAP